MVKNKKAVIVAVAHKVFFNCDLKELRADKQWCLIRMGLWIGGGWIVGCNN